MKKKPKKKKRKMSENTVEWISAQKCFIFLPTSNTLILFS